MKKILLTLFTLFLTVSGLFAQSPFRVGYREKINTYKDEYTRKQMFTIYEKWLEEASTLEIDKVQYDYTVYTQRDKQNYAWVVERGTDNYTNGREVYHWITISISNGVFTIYYPAKGTSLSGHSRFITYDGDGAWTTNIRRATTNFIDRSKEYLKIYNDNYGDTSITQLNEWSEMVVLSMVGIWMTRVFSGLPDPFDE